MRGIVRDIDGRSSIAGKVLSTALAVLLAFSFLNLGVPVGQAAADDATGEGGYQAAVLQDDLTGGEGEAPEPGIAFDEATGTLTIVGYETIAPADVAAYKTKAMKVVIRDVGTIQKEAFAEFRMQ